MAKTQINTKSSTYLRDKEIFLKELKQFNESRNIPYKIPVVNGVEIDLYLFYSLVLQRGGLRMVNQNDTWENFMRQLRLPHPCINGSTLLRRIYGIYLEKYERAKGPPGRDDDNDMDEDPRQRSRGGAMPRISFGGGTYISASGEALRTANRVAAPSERLTLSLLSPMPNEQDFAVNVCTVLAADHSNRLPLSTTPHILDFLLAHAGVYNHSSLRDTIGRSYYEARGRHPHEFWELRAGGGGAKELADETKFMQPGIEQPELMVQALAAHNALTDCLMGGDNEDDTLEKLAYEEALEDWVTEPSEESQLFAPELSGGASCVYTQRVLQIASIVRSLSFHEENVQYLARNTTLIRFLLLCANCWVGSLRQCGLDTLGNVSTELIIKDPATCLLSRHVLSTIQAALVSSDRARVLAALELLNKLAQNEANEDALIKALEAKVYSDVCALLTLRDIMVLVCTLECVYALTSLGDRASESVARVPGLIHTLVSLVTVEAQSYGPRACILMRVVETVSGPGAAVVAEQERTTHAPAPPAPQASHPPHAHHQQQQPQTAKVETTTQPPVSTVPPPLTTQTQAPLTTIQQSHLQQRTVQENEHFAQAWLRSTYEPLPATDNSACDAADVYRQYLACCSKLGRKGVIAPAHFPRLVRTVFGGTVGPNNVTTSTGETQQAYIGIRSRNVQNRSNPPVGPSSPILKAQLTNKPSATEAKPVVVTQTQPAPQQQPPASHPHLSQALEPGPSNTTLIKHLLAHKVSPAHQPTQVAQRQQSQQRVVGPSTPSTVIVQSNQGLDLDPESLIKCTTITPGGVASNTPAVQGEKVCLNAPEEIAVPKEESMQIQLDEQAILKTAQNKMLADLLEKKSNPPVQVVQMAPQMSAPTIQITETGQIVQVKSENNSIIQLNPEQSLVSQTAPYFQIKNEQGQLIQIKNDQGQIIHLKNDQLQGLLQIKNEQGQIVQLKNEQLQGLVQFKNDQGQIVQLKNDQLQGVLQFKNDQGQIVQLKNDQIQGLVQFKNEQGQMVQLKNDQLHGLMQFKNEQGQIVQLKNDQLQGLMQFKNEQGQIVQVKNDQLQGLMQFKNEQGQIVQVKNDQLQGFMQFKNEQGQIVQVKNDQLQGLMQFKNEQGQIVQVKNDQLQGLLQFKNEQGQIVQVKNDQLQGLLQYKNEQGQIVQVKNDQLQGLLQYKNEQGQIVQVKNESTGQTIHTSVIQPKIDKEQADLVVIDHSYTEPPNKKIKYDDTREINNTAHESVSKTAANLYAALAASALEDEDDLLPPKQESIEIIQQPILVAGTADAPVIIQEPILQVQQPNLQVQQPTMQVQQNTLSTMQMTASGGAAVVGGAAVAALMQQSSLQVQQPMLQVQPMDVQNIIASQSGQLILQDKSTTQYVQQPMQIIATPSSSQGGIGYLTQNLPGNMMQKTIIIVQGPTGSGPLTLTVNNPAGLDEATLNSLIAQATEAITQQQIIQNSGVIQSTQRVIVSQPIVSTAQPITVVKTTIAQNAPQITPSQQPIITSQPQPHKAQIVNQPQTQQIVVTQKQPPALISTSSSNQISNQVISSQMVSGNQMMSGNHIVGSNQIVSGNQQLLQGNQQIIAMSNNQQIIMNSPMKPGVHRVVQQPQRTQVVVSTSSSIAQTPIMIDSKPSVIQTTSVKTPQPAVRQVITRQPVMVGNTKIGDKEMVVTQPVPETIKPVPPKSTATPPPQPSTSQELDTPWICHWRGCGKSFNNASEVFTHAARTHCPGGAGGEAPCMWLDCDRVPRKTFALLNHLTDRHCTVQALKAIFNSRRHVTADPEAGKPITLGYPPNAALAALNKHANETFNPRELMDENEGPVTKSIRLTAALILRNIVIYSNTGRRQLRSYEAHLAAIALSTVEASRTIAQVLFDMNNI